MLCGEDLGSAGFMPTADGLALAWSQQIYLSIYLSFIVQLVLEMFSANQYLGVNVSRYTYMMIHLSNVPNQSNCAWQLDKQGLV